MDERNYPIYRLWLTFTKNEHSVSGTRMYKEKLSQEEEVQALREFVDRNLDHPREGKAGSYTLRSLNLEIVETGLIFVCEDTWCCDWFSHYTFNVHLTDEELLLSFQNFVSRHRPYICDLHESIKNYNERVPVEKRACLMGAEDRYRWKGPCRCKYCCERGIVRIDH